MTEPRKIKVDAAVKCEICGGEPYAMVRKPQLTMDITRNSNKQVSSSLLCEEHFHQFTNRSLSLSTAKTSNFNIYTAIGLSFLFCLLVYLLMS